MENKLVVLTASSESLAHIVPVSLPTAISCTDGEPYFLRLESQLCKSQDLLVSDLQILSFNL